MTNISNDFQIIPALIVFNFSTPSSTIPATTLQMKTQFLTNFILPKSTGFPTMCALVLELKNMDQQH